MRSHTEIYYIYCIEYMTIKDLSYIKIYGANLLYLIINKINRYIDEINGNKYWTLVPTNGSKDILKKYEKLWTKKRDHDKTITNKSD